MKVGDLVKVRKVAFGSQLGIVTAHQPAEGNLLESVHVLWLDGTHEIDFPDWLEIVQEAP